MIRKIIPAFILIASFSWECETAGQVKSGVQDYLIERLSAYCKAVPWEDVYIHTDRREYIAGEELWFSTYLTDRLQDIPSSRSKIAYVEILNPLNQSVVQKRVKIDNGSGPGYMNLPDTLTTGKYFLRAYTGLMKNFLPDNCFMKEIHIYNALKDKVLKEKQFLAGIPSEGARKETMPGSSVTLRVDNLKKDSLSIIIETGNNFRSANKNICYLLIHTHGVINRLDQVRLASDRTVIMISRRNLIPGINHITVFDANGKPAGERFIYTPAPEDQIITINAPVNKSMREKITLEIDLSGESVSSADSANMSISVTPLTSWIIEPGISDFLVFGTEFGILPDRIRNKRLSDLSAGFIDSCLLNLKSSWIDWEKVLSPIKPVLSYRQEDENHYISGRLIKNNSADADSSVYVILSTPGKAAGFQYATTDREGRFTFAVPIGESIKDLILQPLEANRSSSIQIESSFPGIYPKTTNVLKNTELVIPSYIKKWSNNYQVGKIYGAINFNFPSVSPAVQLNQKRFYGKPDIELIMDDYIKLPVMSEVFFELLPGVFLKSRRSVWEISIADPETNRIYDESPVMMVDGVVIDDAAKIANLDPELVERIDVIKERYLVGDFLFFGIVNVITRAGDFSNVALPDYASRLQYRVTEPVNIFNSPDYSTPEMKQRRIPDFRNTLYWNPSVILGKDGKTTIEFWSSDYAGNYVIDIQGITASGTKISLRKSFTIR